MKIRCSKLDALMSCPPSVLDTTAVRIDREEEAATIGKAVHAMAADLIERQAYNVMETAAMFGLDTEQSEEAAALMLYLMRAWDELRRYFPTPRTECGVAAPLSADVELTGTVDLLSPLGETKAVFCDWKTGRVDSNYQHQMAGYAYCLWTILGQPEDGLITGIVVFLRHHYYRVVKYTPAMLRSWHHDLTHNALAAATKFRPGRVCPNCEIYASCQARKAEVTGVVDSVLGRTTGDPKWTTFVDQATGLLANIDADNKHEPAVGDIITTLMTRARLAKEAADDVVALVRDTIRRVGPIDTGEFTTMELATVTMKTLDPVKSLPVLRRHLSDAEICGGMKLSLPQMQSAYAAKKGRGEKVAAKIQIESELDRAGAIVVSLHERMTERLKPQKKEGEDVPGTDGEELGDGDHGAGESA
ncbi:MAG: PD-(D/E)XK nuclease family protein [Phycisphaeraceae bacterium]|nr:PD-(D/E)XK nuclease family protein [Phycisphaeraceae bacterium]